MNTSLRLPAAQQLSVEQVHPLLLRVVGRGTGGFWSLPAAQAFSTEQLVQIAGAIVQYEMLHPGATARDSKRLLQLPNAAGVDAELLHKMALSALEWIQGDSSMNEEGWKSIEVAGTIRRLRLKQFLELLGLGFEIGFVPEMLWRLPVAEQGLPLRVLERLILKEVKTDVPRVPFELSGWAAALQGTAPQQQHAPGHALHSGEDGHQVEDPWVMLFKTLALSQQSMELLLLLPGAQQQLQQLSHHEGLRISVSGSCCLLLAHRLLGGYFGEVVAVSTGGDASATGGALQLKTVEESCRGWMKRLREQLPYLVVATAGGPPPLPPPLPPRFRERHSE